jgi:NADH-quinone oxidoreductase subunit F
MPTYQELVEQAEPARRRINGLDRPRIAVQVDTSSIASGALDTLKALRDEVERRGLNVDVDQVGGNGLSFANPVVELVRDGSRILYQKLTPDQVPAFVESVVAGGKLGEEWALGVLEGSANGALPRMEDYPWWSIQVRRLMEDMGYIDPKNIDESIARGAYSGLAKALDMGQEEIINEVLGSRLRGRSGSDFPTGRKWDFLRTSPTNPKAVVCNADEGDSGAWVNRMTMECDPHALIEGMAICGVAAGAIRGYIYIREEYPLAFERMQKAVDQAREKGIIGERVLDSDFAFDLKVVRGAGSYVCGEESGLIASVEDGRGMPKIRPPFPAASGVFGQGSNVNNVETFHSCAWLFRNSVEKYLEIDTGRNAGTMMFTVSGHVQRVGCFELAMDRKVQELYEVCGGGPQEGRAFKAMQPGGPLTGIMPEFSLGLNLEPEDFKSNGMAAMGGGGMVFLDDSSCIVDLCSQFEWFLEDESCGRCTTCHGGTQRMVEILRRIKRGGGRESDMAKLRLLAATLRYSNCIHGQAAPSIIVQAMDWFSEEVEEHIYQRRCRSKRCKGLIRYEVSGEDPNMPRAAAYCPTNAIKEEDGSFRIDDGLCIRCDTCYQIAPGGIVIVDAFQGVTGPAPEPIAVQPPYE